MNEDSTDKATWAKQQQQQKPEKKVSVALNLHDTKTGRRNDFVLGINKSISMEHYATS